MARRFNPAPGWPPAPEGWVPPPGWRPDPTWPPAPHGWQFVIDDGVHASNSQYAPASALPVTPQPVSPYSGTQAASAAVSRPWHQRTGILLSIGGALLVGFVVAFSVIGALGAGDDGRASPSAGGQGTTTSPTEPASEMKDEQAADEVEAAEAAAQAEADAAEAAEAEAAAAAQAEAEAAAAAAEAEAAAAAAFGDQPAVQTQFVEAVVTAQNAARDAENDLQRGAAKAQRDQAICSLLPSKQIAGWTGRITEIDANGDGKGIFTVEVAEDVEIGTWNNAFSDFQDDTLVEPSSPVFTSGLALEEGQLVRFSGTLVADSSEGCLREASLTLNGGLTTPSFIFRFSELTGL